MKIIQVIQKNQLRGAEIAAADMANQWIKSGHDVLMVSLFSAIGRLRFNGRLVCLEANERKRLIDVSSYRRLAYIVKEFGADVVVANAGDTLKYCVLSRAIFRWNAKLVFRNASTMSAYIHSLIVKVFNCILLSQVDLVLSVSTASAKDITELFPSLSGKTRVLYNGIDLNRFTRVRKILGDGGPDILHVGGFTFEKNHFGLLRIFSLFRADYPNARLHLVGDGPMLAAVREYISANGLENSVLLHGWVERVEEVLTHADVLVLPSLLEGLPSVVLEAFASRVPVVANRVGGVDEINQAVQTCFLVDPQDEPGFVLAMKCALSLEGVKLTEAAFQFVHHNFDIQKNAKEYELILTSMVV